MREKQDWKYDFHSEDPPFRFQTEEKKRERSNDPSDEKWNHRR